MIMQAMSNQTRTRISFMDFLDLCERVTTTTNQASVLAKQMNEQQHVSQRFPVIPPLRKTHIFYLGKDAEIDHAVQTVKSDLLEDISQDFPMPFVDVACVSTLDDCADSWVMDRLIRVPTPELVNYSPPNCLPLLHEPKHAVFLMRITEIPPSPVWMIMLHGGPDPGGRPGALLSVAADPVLVKIAARTGNSIDFLTGMAEPVLLQLAMISHPMNYLVKTSPKLTTKEQHWVESGKRPIPIRKTPHFIVVDHTVLVRMRNGEQGDDQEGELDRASPVPHHRRGHWARLAERCRHARLLGKNRVWKRPTFVGDRKFEDDRNYYEVVIPEESKKELSA